MTTTASTPADPDADFERAARQALRLIAPPRLRLVSTRPRPRPTATAVPSTDADVEALAISVGVLSPVDAGPR